MLNRRFLRIKAVQAVFAYNVRKEANVFRSHDFIDDSFAPNLSAAERPDYEALAQDAKKAKEVFTESYESRELTQGVNTKVRKAVENALRFYDANNQEDKKQIKQQLLGDTTIILDSYHHILGFFVQLADLVEKNFELRKSKNSGLLVNVLSLNIAKNQFIQKLRHHEDYQYLIAKYDATWQTDDEQEFLRSIHKDILLKDEAWIEYQSQQTLTYEQDCEIISHIVKKIFFKKDLVQSFYEAKDINWDENEEIVKSLTLKTIKKAASEQEIIFYDLSLNWDDDKQFLLDLFSAGVEESEDIKKAIDKRLQNWDSDRIALTDKIVIQLALHEMMMFPSIPVKVTINEFIEAAKRYSTPKSKIFVNGILDKASKDLLEEGKIKKSGRGLLDNK